MPSAAAETMHGMVGRPVRPVYSLPTFSGLWEMGFPGRPLHDPIADLSSARVRFSDKRFRHSTFQGGGGELGSRASQRLAGPLVSGGVWRS